MTDDGDLKEGSARNNWVKARNEFMRQLVVLAQADPFIIVGDQEEDFKVFAEFVRRKVVVEVELKNAEFYALLMFLKHEKMKEAADEYSFRAQKIEPDNLQKQARRVRNKILKHLGKNKDNFAHEWERFLEERQKNVN